MMDSCLVYQHDVLWLQVLADEHWSLGFAGHRCSTLSRDAMISLCKKGFLCMKANALGLIFQQLTKVRRSEESQNV